ncbi:MAG TPA: sugar transferase [Sedimentisphaerales bacterium]|nr:sugar transferase [Sedimentisphaerales bacterium]
MQLIVVHKKTGNAEVKSCGLLRFALGNRPIADLTLRGLTKRIRVNDKDQTVIAVPQEWTGALVPTDVKVKYYRGTRITDLNCKRKDQSEGWFIISDARYASRMDCRWLNKAADNLDYDLIAFNVDNSLFSHGEKAVMTSAGCVAGFRRLYCDRAVPAQIPQDWPVHMFIKPNALRKVLIDDSLPLNYAEFINRCRRADVKSYCLTVGGTVLDLETEAGLLNFLTAELGTIHNRPQNRHADSQHCKVSRGARLFGKVLLGEGVQLGDEVIIVGPAILGDNVKAAAATIKQSVIAPALVLPKGCLIQNRIISTQFSKKRSYGYGRTAGLLCTNPLSRNTDGIDNNFRTWPFFSYPRTVKRIADIAGSLVMLALLAPIFPVIAIAVKLTSPGGVFFRHQRQGLHGKKFSCLKFRTMIQGADEIQEKLRFKNQADGPQFKVDDDPRITGVGGFLRDTFIDETPQLVNILLGQMSFVGPRPSPKAENLFCPSWRYARLSVRPGITGLWQICRTRRPGRDFQEWIYYDTSYVRNVSLGLDLFIFCRTVKKLVLSFIRKF